MTPSSGGGSKVQGPPTQAQQILQKMHEDKAQKKLDAGQQAASLREQSKSQQDLRRATETEKGAGEEAVEERGKGEKGEKSARARGQERTGDTRTKTQREMDSFLSRKSAQQSYRRASREFGKERQTRSLNPQAWSVANSSKTPPQARKAILAKKAEQQFQKQSAGKSQTATTQQPTARQATPVRTPSTMAQPKTAEGPPIRYTLPKRPGSEGQARPFAQRNFATKNLTQQLNRLFVQTQGKGMEGLMAQKGVVVHLRGNLVFVRDGNKMRAFKLNKDGSLRELPTEDSSEQPLSPEAKDLLRKVLRQRGLRSGADGKQTDAKGEISQKDLAKLVAQQKAEKGKTEGKLDFETRFALLLYEALEEHKKIGKKLGEGEDPKFPTKKDWEAFFAKLMKMGNQEKTAKKSLDEILSLMFRGLFNKKGKGKFLVGDLMYMKSGKNRTEKFAQIQISNEALLKMLTQMNPGAKMNAATLKGFFGEELAFLIMAHMESKSFAMGEGAEKNILFNPKGSFDPYSQARLEDSLFGKRKGGTRGTPGSLPEETLPDRSPKGILANVYELAGLRELYEGKPRFYTFVVYALLTGIVGLGLAFLLLKFL